jgi:hypothetical protein
MWPTPSSNLNHSGDDLHKRVAGYVERLNKFVWKMAYKYQDEGKVGKAARVLDLLVDPPPA